MSDFQNEEKAVYTSPAQQPAPAPEPEPASYTGEKVATKKEFVNLPENTKLRKDINSAAIVCYICAGVTLVVALAAGSLGSILDVLILVGLGLGIHLARSKACAIILTVYAALSMIISLVSYGTLGGWLVLVAGIIGIINTAKLSKAWKAYNE